MNYKQIGIQAIGNLIALMWAAAAFGKLNDMEEFRFQLGQSPLLQGFEELVWRGVPMIEILLVFALGFRHSRQLGFYASIFLLSLFTAYIIAILKYSYYIPCACSGFAEGLSWQGHIVFNLSFMGIAIAGVFLNRDESLMSIKTLRNRVKAAP